MAITAQLKISGFDLATSIVDTDSPLAYVGGKTKRIPLYLLREQLNKGAQNITGQIDGTDIVLTGDITAIIALFTTLTVSGHLKAATLEGNGALLYNLLYTGVGGTSSTGSLSLVCNSDGSTPLAKVIILKNGVVLGEWDENGLRPATEIPYSHADAAIPFNKDLNLAGWELLNSRTIMTMFRWPHYWFDGAADAHIVAPSSTKIDGLFLNGATYIGGYNAKSAGLASNRFFDKKSNTTALRMLDTSGKITFTHKFSTTDGQWDSVSPIQFDENSVITVRYNASSTANNPTIEINGVDVPLVQTLVPTGTATDDAGGSLYLGNTQTVNRTFHGARYFDIFLNYELSDAEIASFSPQKATEYRDETGSNVDITAGPLVLGKRYRTKTFVSGDDFSNVADTGASANVSGAEWIAIGTTPTTWTNGSILTRLGVILAYMGDNTDTTAYDSSGNGINGVVTAAILTNKSRQLTEERGTFTATLTCGTSGTITLNPVVEAISYIKLGSKVDFYGQLLVGSVSAPLGNLVLNGSPFALTDSADYSERVAFKIESLGTLATAVSGTLAGDITAGQTVINIRDGYGTTGGRTSDFANHIQAGTALIISGSFLTDD